MPSNIELVGPVSRHYRDVLLNPDAVNFVTHLELLFRAKRKKLLGERKQRQIDWDLGIKPDFLESTSEIRKSAWKVVDAPADLRDRRVEITGPADRKMMIHAFNSGARVFMADMEDACSPTWENILQSFDNINLAVRRKLDFSSEEGKKYELQDKIATLMVRPRGWHLSEKHIIVDDEPISASLFDFGLHIFHNAKELLKRGSGPYFYLPKMENHLEARLWNEVFVEAEGQLGIPSASIRATALIETITAAFEMEEILWELRNYMTGLNAGRWDYLFSFIKKFGKSKAHIFPDRQELTMNVPFMRAYALQLVQTCHRRNAHAIGGMSAFIPNRKNPEMNERALAAVRADKKREAEDGFDGTWVAHPDLVGVARDEFDKILGNRANQKELSRLDVHIEAQDLLNTTIVGSHISLNGLKNNIRITVHYMNKWLEGSGAVAIDNLMEDTATAEISRAQIWQWLHHGCLTREGKKITPELYQELKRDVLATFTESEGKQNYLEASNLLDSLVLCKECPDFLTLPAYKLLN